MTGTEGLTQSWKERVDYDGDCEKKIVVILKDVLMMGVKLIIIVTVVSEKT